MADEQSQVQKVADLIKGIQTCMLTTIGDDGHLRSRPMVVQQVRFDGDLWFVTDGGSGKIAQIQQAGQVNAAFATRDTWVSLVGTAEVHHDDAKAEELWNSSLDTWFPGGPRTPGLALIEVRAQSAEYCDIPLGGPMGAASSVITLASAKVKGERPDIGENETVELGSGNDPGGH